VEGLVAILPDENFKNYLDQQSYTLIYATEGANEVASENVNLFDLEYFMKVPVTTMTRLCAAFTEVRLFNNGVDPGKAGYVDLRKELRRGPYSTDMGRITKRAEEVRMTIKQLAFLCNQWSLTNRDFTHPAQALSIEYWLAEQELDDIVGIALSQDWRTFSESSLRYSYYLTLPETTPKNVVSLDVLLTAGGVNVDADSPVASFRSLRRLFLIKDDDWYPLSEALLRLDLPQVLGRSAYLTSRLLSEMPHDFVDAEHITDEAALACYVYCLAEPYYYYWPHGDHERHLLQGYVNFHEQFDKFIDTVEDRQRKTFYHALKIWWDYREHDFKRRKKLLEEAVKELESIKGSEENQQFPMASQLYELFSEMLRMFSRTWQPVEAREKLLQAGYQQLVNDTLTTNWDVLNFTFDPKQPSPLFFMELHDFLNLSEETHMIRTKQSNSHLKAEELIKIGTRLGQHIGLNFYKFMATYKEPHTMLQTREEDELPYELEIDPGEKLNNSLLLPEHERLGMRGLYCSSIANHAALIYNLRSKPVESKITPIEVTQHESILVDISLTGKTKEMLDRGMEVEVILLSSKDYDIHSRIVRKKFGIPRPVEFTIAFHTTGDVPLLFEYIIDNKYFYPDEAWVHVIGLERQVRNVRNPYQYGDVILSPENHYGRQQELKQILDELCNMAIGQERQNFRLHGVRRSGKTSLLHIIRSTIEDPETRRIYRISEEMGFALDKWYPVFYDLQELPRDPKERQYLDSTVFFRSLTKNICEALHWTKKATQAVLTRIDEDFARSGNIVADVRTELERVLNKLSSNERILILLDEVDLIDPERDDRFFGQLRSIILSPQLRRIVWILTSVRVLQAAREEVESPLHNIFASITLKNLDAAEARRLILEPARKANIYFSPEATESILQQTGRQPYFLQVVCSKIVDQLNKKQTSFVSDSFVNPVIDQLLQPGTVIYEQCGFLWDWVSRSRRIILALLAQEEQGMFKGDLIEAFRSIISPLATEEFDANTLFADAWNELFANDLVSQDQDDFCRLTIPIFQRWLKRRDLDPYDLR